MEVILSISLIAGFAVASFLFAAAESAFFSLSLWQTRRLAKEHPGRGELVSRLLANPQELISSLALGSTFANCVILGLGLRQIIGGSTCADCRLRLSSLGASWDSVKYCPRPWRCDHQRNGRCAWPSRFGFFKKSRCQFVPSPSAWLTWRSRFVFRRRSSPTQMCPTRNMPSCWIGLTNRVCWIGPSEIRCWKSSSLTGARRRM